MLWNGACHAGILYFNCNVRKSEHSDAVREGPLEKPILFLTQLLKKCTPVGRYLKVRYHAHNSPAIDSPYPEPDETN
jgi:hypothetical protein